MIKSLLQFLSSTPVTSYTVSLAAHALGVLGLVWLGMKGTPQRQVEVLVLYGEFAIESEASAGQTANDSVPVKMPLETPPEPEPTLQPTTEPRQRAPRREAPAPLDGDQPSSGEAGMVDKPIPLVMLPPPQAPRETPTTKPVAPPRSASPSRPPGGRVGSAHQVVTRSNNRPPIYPASLLHQRIEGTVLLELQVSPEGNVLRVAVLRSSGYPMFDASAVNAAQTWSMAPAINDGVPVETIIPQEVIFRIKR